MGELSLNMNFFKYLITLLLCNLTLFATPLEKVSLQLHWLDQFEFAGYYMAKEKGYYKEAGFDVEFKNYKYGLDIQNEVANENATFGIGGSDLIIGLSQGKQFKLLASIFQSSPLVLLTTPRSGIKSIKDFKNKKIMITPDVVTSVTFNAMMLKQNISMKDMIIQKHSFEVQDLIDGKTDLLQSYLSNEPYELKKQGIKPVVFDPKEYGFDLYSDILFTSQKYYEKDPLKVFAFKEATLKGWRYAFDNIEEAIEIMLQKYNVQKRSKEALFYEAKISKELAYVDNIPFGDISPYKIQRIYDIYNLLNLTKNKIDFDSVLINEDEKILLSTKEKEFIQKHPIVTIASTTDSAPMLIKEKDGKLIGMDVEIADIIYKKTGLKIEYQNYSWEEAVNKALAYEVDGLSASVYNKEREEYFNFSSSYIKSTPKIFVKKGNPQNIKTLKDLQNKTVAVRRGTQLIESFAKKVGSKVFYTKDSIGMIQAVIENNADYILFFDNIEFIANREGINYIDVAFTLPKSTEVVFSTRKDYPELNSIITKVLDSIPEYQKVQLRQKWFGYQTKKVIDFSNTQELYIKNKGPIKMCVDPNWLPMEKLDNKENHIGIAADVFKLIKENSNLQFEVIVTNSWEESLTKIKNKQCDILSLAMKTKSRSEYMDFTKPYLTFPFVIATKSKVNFIDTMEDLHDKTIAIVKDYAYAEIIQSKYPKIKTILVSGIQEGIQLVQNNKAFGYVDALAPIAYYLQQEGIADVRINGKFEDKWELSIATRDDEPILQTIMQKILDSISKEQIDQIANKWLAVKFEQKINYQYLYQILFLFIIVIFIGWWRYSQVRKINKLTQEKNYALEKVNLEQKLASQIKSEFLANISHEIRTPLYGVIGLIDLLYETKIDQKQQEYLHKAKESSEILLYLINDILDFSKLEAGKFKIDRSSFCFEEFTNSVRNIFMFKIEEKGLDFDFIVDKAIPKRVIGDMVRIQQIVNNLLFNAIKFTHEGKVSLTIELFKENQDTIKLLFSIKDSGIGISKEAQKKLFIPFEQGDITQTKQYGGTGLGLVIVKDLIEMMDGEIKCRSELGKGSEFLFTIVLQKDDQNQVEDCSRKNKERFLQAQGEILVAEDNSINALILKNNFEKYGLRVTFAINGKEAVSQVQKKHFDIIFMDIQMPVMDGIEATKKIRKLGIETPIVALSASAMQIDKNITLQAGMDGHLSKPIEWNKVEEVLSKYLKVSYLQIDKKTQNKIDLVLDSVDIAKIINYHGVDQEYCKVILKNFYNKYENYNEQLEEIKNDITQRKRYFHNLKGLSANLHMQNVSKYAAKLEQEDKLHSNNKNLKSLHGELDIILEEIKEKIISKDHNLQKQPLSKEELIQNIKQVLFAIEDFNLIEDEKVDLIVDNLELHFQKEFSDLKKIYYENEYDILSDKLHSILEKLDRRDKYNSIL